MVWGRPLSPFPGDSTVSVDPPILTLDQSKLEDLSQINPLESRDDFGINFLC